MSKSTSSATESRSFPDPSLEPHFITSQPRSYWHFMAKNKTDAASYNDSDAIGQQILRIEKKTKRPNTFESKSVNKWTPLHVAAIAGNKAGLEFFLSKNVSRDELDDNGKKPADYLLLYHPDRRDLLALFDHCPSSSSTEETEQCPPTDLIPSQEVIDQVVARWHVHLPRTPARYQANTHDFGVIIRQLLFTNRNSKKEMHIQHMITNMQSVASEEGFSLKLAKKAYCPRDNRILLPNGRFVSPATSTNTPLAIERCQSLALVQNRDKGGFRTDHLYFQGTAGSAHQMHTNAIHDFPAPDAVPTLRFYMEGGNYFIATNASGKRQILMGTDTLSTAHNQLRLDKFYNEPGIDVNSVAARILLTLTPQMIQEGLKDMYAQGLLNPKKGLEKGFITKEEMSIISKTTVSSGVFQSLSTEVSSTDNPYLQTAIQLEFYKPWKITDAQIEASRKMVAQYLAQREIAVTLMAMSFSDKTKGIDVRSEDIHFIPQAEYHLDVFMRPGPNGSFFLQSYGFSLAVLNGIKDNATMLNLSDADLEILERYIVTAAKLDREIGPLLAEAKTKLENAGFTVIPAPGIFYDVSPYDLLPNIEGKESRIHTVETFNVNFLNAITGWSEKNNRHYFITSGATVKDRLGGGVNGSIRTIFTIVSRGN